jgi:hypothetical protein
MKLEWEIGLGVAQRWVSLLRLTTNSVRRDMCRTLALSMYIIAFIQLNDRRPISFAARASPQASEA